MSEICRKRHSSVPLLCLCWGILFSYFTVLVLACYSVLIRLFFYHVGSVQRSPERPSLDSGLPPIHPIKVKGAVAVQTDWFPRNKNNHTGKSEKISWRNLQTIGTIYNCLKVENGMEIVQIIAACEANLWEKKSNPRSCDVTIWCLGKEDNIPHAVTAPKKLNYKWLKICGVLSDKVMLSVWKETVCESSAYT